MSTDNTNNTVDPIAHARCSEADNLVKNYVIVSLGLGLIPVPAADLAGFMALQVKLVHGLAKHYEVPFKENLGKSLIASLLSGGGSALAVLGLGSLAKAVPVLGVLSGGAGVSISAGALTYAVGHVFIKHFEAGGTMLNFDAEKTRDIFESKIKEGVEVARNLKKNGKTATEETPAESAPSAA